MRLGLGMPVLMGVALLSSASTNIGQISAQAVGTACARCAWRPPATSRTVTVRSVDQLMTAVRQARPSTTILLEDGEYRLPFMLDFPSSDVVLRSKSGDRHKVWIGSTGMDERQVGVALSISAPRVTIADLTIGSVGYHGVQIRGESGASNVVMHNLRVVDTGQQLVKVTVSRTQSADNGLLACSLIEYTNHAPSNYTDGIDALGAKGWVVRDNRFVRIRGPQAQRWSAGPAVLFWANSVDTIVERNEIIDSFRGVALGLLAEAQELARPGDHRFDHQGGIVRNNVICNLNSWADEGIEINGAHDARVDHNSVMVEGSLPWSISARFPLSSGWIRNNLTSRDVIFRDGSGARVQGNVTGAAQGWFVSPATCDLRLTDAAAPAYRPGATAVPEVADDFARTPRPGVGTTTAGAFARSEVKR